MSIEKIKIELQQIDDITLDCVEGNLLIYPQSNDAISNLLKFCNEKQIAIIPIGNGSQITETGAGKIYMSTRKMNKIIEFSKADLTVSVESGITIKELNDMLKKYNFFLPVSHHEKAESTIGGLLARDAGGIEQYTYGTINDFLLGIDFITPTGTLIKAGGKTVKNVSGYDFTRLFAKSWGTLGIITSATFKLLPLPDTKVLCITSEKSLETISTQMKEVLFKKLSLVSFLGIPSDFTGFELKEKHAGLYVFAGSNKAVNKHLDLIKSSVNVEKVVVGRVEVDNYLENLFTQIDKTKTDKILLGSDRKTLLEKVTKILDAVLKEINFNYIVDGGAGTVQILANNMDKIKTVIEEKLKLEKVFYEHKKVPVDFLYNKLKNELDPNNILYPNNPRFTEES